jgi:hypothetical protein
MKKNRISKFELEAESLVNSYAGNEYLGNQNYAGGGDYIGSNFAGEDGLNTIDEADRTFTVRIANAHVSEKKDAILFGAFEFPTLTQTADVTVTVDESSHDQLREESKSNPMFIKGLKYVVSSEAQFNNNISLERGTPTGAKLVKSFQPLQYRSAMNQINTQIDAPAFAFEVDGRSKWTIPVEAASSLTLIMTVKTRGDISQVLKGKGVVGIGRGNVPTGDPRIDLAR